ncbi:MAG TPA: hypothetical protein VE687_17325 [Stellaceae bacterium]|nr:hypothetical protein [Stellaceae bacterium]
MIDDDEEAVLPLEAEVALRRRAAEVGFSTLDWIVQLLELHAEQDEDDEDDEDDESA